jgi:hypothetical protein
MGQGGSALSVRYTRTLGFAQVFVKEQLRKEATTLYASYYLPHGVAEYQKSASNHLVPLPYLMFGTLENVGEGELFPPNSKIENCIKTVIGGSTHRANGISSKYRSPKSVYVSVEFCR